MLSIFKNKYIKPRFLCQETRLIFNNSIQLKFNFINKQMETQENKINPENNEIQNIPKEEIKSNSQEQNNNIKAFTKPTERLKTKVI